MRTLLSNKKIRNTLLIAIPVTTAIICMGIGRLYISPFEIVESLWNLIFNGPDSVDPQIYTTLINIRLPRIILAVLCGAGLSVAGGAFQSIFSNALATPDTLGVSAGASFGAATALYFGAGLFFVQLAGLAMGFLAVILTYFISNRKNTLSIIMVILAGFVIAALFDSGVSIVKMVADPNSTLPAITFWLMGSLANIGYGSLAIAAPFMIVGMITLFALRWKLNILMLNEDEAKAMGVNVFAMRIVVGVAATMITAACVSLCGQIGWVGLLIPHVCRMLFGSNNKDLIPAAISFGATFLLLIDTFARAGTSAEIPITILTSIIGAPLFIILLRRTGGANL